MDEVKLKDLQATRMPAQWAVSMRIIAASPLPKRLSCFLSSLAGRQLGRALMPWLRQGVQ